MKIRVVAEMSVPEAALAPHPCHGGGTRALWLQLRKPHGTNNQHHFPKVFPTSGNLWPHPSQSRYSGKGVQTPAEFIGK